MQSADYSETFEKACSWKTESSSNIVFHTDYLQLCIEIDYRFKLIFYFL